MPARKPSSTHPRRADLGAATDSFFEKLEPERREAALLLRDVVRKAAPDAAEAIKWGMPVFSLGGLLCYIAARKGCVTLGFYEAGTSLSDPDGLLEGTGKRMRHVNVARKSDVRRALFAKWVREAAAINRRSAR